MHKGNEMTQIIIMRHLLCVITLLLVTFAIGESAYARHCDVRSGDSMWRIAKRYHINFHKILKMNKHYKDPHMIHPNDEVQLPHDDTGQQTEEDSKGDNIEDGEDRTSETQISTEMKQVLNLVNQERAKQGLKSLQLDNQLTNVATVKAKDMRDKNYFDNNSPTYGTPFEMMQQFGVHYSYAGENIAAGQKSAEQVMNDWMNSSGHRANILNKNYTHLGVGYVKGGSYGTYWVQEFTKPQ